MQDTTPASNMKRRKQTHADKEAADWIVRLHARDATRDDWAEHETWLKAKPQNEYAFRIQQQYWDQIPAVRHVDNYDALIAESFYERMVLKASVATESLLDAMPWRPRVAGALATLLVTAFVALGLFLSAEVPMKATPIAVAELVTEVAEIREQRLTDGSTVTLGAQSRINVNFTPAERRVVLLAGEAFFEVEADPARPFFVEAGDSITRVVGTKFDVRLGADSVSVAVAEGRVDVARLIRPVEETTLLVAAPAASLIAGQKIVLPATEISDKPDEELHAMEVASLVSDIDTADVALWREGRLKYVEARLSDVVADLNRYYRGEIILGDDEVGKLEFTASLRSGDIDKLLQAIDINLPVAAVHRPNGRVILTVEDDR